MGNEDYKVNFVGNEILLSGTVVVINNDVEFRFKDLTVTVKFVNDDENNEPRSVPTNVSDKRMEYVIYNFNSVTGTGNTHSLNFGTLGGKSFYLNFIVIGFGEKHKVLHYTWFMEGDSGKTK